MDGGSPSPLDGWGYPFPVGWIGGYPFSVGWIGGYFFPVGWIGGYPFPVGWIGGYSFPVGWIGGYPFPVGWMGGGGVHSKHNPTHRRRVLTSWKTISWSENRFWCLNSYSKVCQLLCPECVLPVFPKIEHPANVVRIVLFEYIVIGSVVELNFC